MKRFASLVSPFMATKTVPGPTRRESYSTPLTGGLPLELPLWESTSAPSRSCWKVIGVDYIRRRDAACRAFVVLRHPLRCTQKARRAASLLYVCYRPNFTITLDPAATLAPGDGDCSRATPLPMASRSRPTSWAASTAERTFLPRNDGTAIPPSSTSRTTVPLAGNFFSGGASGFGDGGPIAATGVAGSFCVIAAGTTWAAMVED